MSYDRLTVQRWIESFFVRFLEQPAGINEMQGNVCKRTCTCKLNLSTSINLTMYRFPSDNSSFLTLGDSESWKREDLLKTLMITT